jgi:hypothetical protein
MMWTHPDLMIGCGYLCFLYVEKPSRRLVTNIWYHWNAPHLQPEPAKQI